jgi:hypothetical protein
MPYTPGFFRLRLVLRGLLPKSESVSQCRCLNSLPRDVIISRNSYRLQKK